MFHPRRQPCPRVNQHRLRRLQYLNRCQHCLYSTYGGTSTANSIPVTLQLTAAGGQLSLPCNGYMLTQPLVTDGSGHFSVAATEYSSPPGLQVNPITLTGTASGDTITATNDASQPPEGTYTVVKGKDAPVFDGACPG